MSDYSYYSSDSSYEFNPFDSDTFPDPMDDSQMMHEANHLDLSHETEQLSLSNSNLNANVDENNQNVLWSPSVEHSRSTIQQVLGCSPSQLRSSPFNGLVVLRLQDFCLLRNDKRCQRLFPHLIFLDPTENDGSNELTNFMHFITNELNRYNRSFVKQ